jgi:hypothetical protein
MIRTGRSHKQDFIWRLGEKILGQAYCGSYIADAANQRHELHVSRDIPSKHFLFFWNGRTYKYTPHLL